MGSTEALVEPKVTKVSRPLVDGDADIGGTMVVSLGTDVDKREEVDE